MQLNPNTKLPIYLSYLKFFNPSFNNVNKIDLVSLSSKVSFN